MYHLPDFAPDNGIFVIDTSDMFSALQGDIGEKRSLEKMCNLLRIEIENAHNAGNDAHVSNERLFSVFYLIILNSIHFWH